MSWGRGFGGNREVSPLFLLSPRGDLRAAWAGAHSEEGGSWGKHGFLHGSEPQASDAHGRPGQCRNSGFEVRGIVIKRKGYVTRACTGWPSVGVSSCTVTTTWCAVSRTLTMRST